LYLGEINSSQQEAWRKTIEIFEDGPGQAKTVALFPEDRAPAISREEIVRIRLQDLQLKRPRQWGACWLATELYESWSWIGFGPGSCRPVARGRAGIWFCKPSSPTGCWTRAVNGNCTGNGFEATALADLLGADFGLVESHKLYECLDLLLPHKQALFDHLTGRWKDLFNAQFDVLLYDLTSTYFESHPPFPEGDRRKFGYSRDKRPDCVQVVIALIVTPEASLGL